MADSLPAGEAMMNGNQSPQNTNSAHLEVAPESGVLQSLVVSGIIVGLLLVLIGLGFVALGKALLLASLLTCVGFGLVLVSFGAKAGGSWAGFTVTGAGAMAIVLFLLLQQFTPPPPNFKRGQLRGDFAKVADLRIVDENPLYAFRDKTTLSIKFIIVGNKLKSDHLSILVDTNEKGDGKEFFELIAPAKQVHDRYLSNENDVERVIQWTFDYSQRIVKDGSDILFQEPGRLPQDTGSRASAVISRGISPISYALADGPTSTSPQIPSVGQIEMLIQNLVNDDATVRRNARDALSVLTSNAPGRTVPTLMSAYRADRSNYRIRLGTVYVMADALRRDPAKRSEISAALNDDDFPLLVEAASEDDKTISYQAAQFLALMGDPRAVRSSVEAARTATDPDKAVNQLIITRQSGRKLPDSTKNQILRGFSEPGSNNEVVKDSGYLKGLFKW